MKNKLLLKISFYDDNHEYITDTYCVDKIKDFSKINIEELAEEAKESKEITDEDEMTNEAKRLTVHND